MPRRPNIINEFLTSSGMETLNPKAHHELYPEGMTATDFGDLGETTEEDYGRGDPGAEEDAQTVLRSEAHRSLMASMISSSSRRKGRKQSKPIRLLADEDEMGNVPHGAAEGATGVTPMEEAGVPRGGGDEHMDDDNQVVCDLCDDSFSSQAQLSDHVQSVHNLGNAMEDYNYPTKYHQLGSQLQEAAMNTVLKMDNASPDQRFSPPGGQGENDSQGSSSGDGSNKNRIFHQDAYCTLCDREFCNKYFLKTHKANKHGIYENGGSDSPGSVGSQNGFSPMVPAMDAKLLQQSGLPLPNLPLSMAPASMAMSMAPVSMAMSLAQSGMTMPPVSLSMPSMVSASVPSMVSASSLQSQPPPTYTASSLPPQLQKPSTPSKPTDTPPKQAQQQQTSGGSNSKPPLDMEDYCEICQKHFCNKYYLKKHKQDVHGIIPDTPPQKRSRTTPSSGGAISSASSIITTTAPLGLPHNPSVMAAANGLPNMTTMANVMFLNPFAPPVTVLQPGLQHMPMGFMPQGIPGLPQVPPPPPHGQVSVSEAGQIIKGQSDSTSPGQEREGVLNQETYCEVCRKEFCNKYFMKIHLANKHGIFEDGLPTQPAGVPPTSEGGTSVPMSLVVSENGRKDGELSPSSRGSEKDHGEKREENGGKMDEENKERKEKDKSENEEFFCKACSKAYPNWYSLRIHQINVHEIIPQDLKAGQVVDMPPGMKMKVESGEAGHRQFSLDGLNLSHATSDRNISGNTIFGNMIAAKLADRVVCDICNKEVCNKYFLRTHKMKVHGIDPNSLEKEVQRTPPKAIQQDGPTDLSKKSPSQGSQVSSSGSGKEAEGLRPPDEELLKMGIDPEAYCEICKKEFCSKYFLKTHKLNIHGIKIENCQSQNKERTPPTSKSSTPQPSLMMMPTLPAPPHSAMPTQALPTMIHQQLPPSAHFPFPPFPISMNQEMEMAMDGRSSWKWREPINATRVMCELCNKELCNKYFLKTHLLNKHGIHLNTVTGERTKNSGGSGSVGGGDGSQGSTPAVSPGSKESSNPPNTEEMFKEHFAKMAHMESAMNKESVIKSTMSLNNKTIKTEEDVLKQQQMMDSSMGMVQAKTWHVPQEYRDQKQEERKPLSERMTNGSLEEQRSEGESFIQKCDICGMLFGESITLQLHKMRDHKMPSEGAMPEYRSSFAASIGLSLRKKYQRHKLRNSRRWRRLGNCGVAIGDKVKSAIVNYVQNHQRRKKFRCAHCQERFLSRVQCQAHIRAEHQSHRPADSAAYLHSQQQRANAASKNNGHRVSPPGGAKVPVSYAQARPLQERSSNYLMQPFQLEAKPVEQQQEPANFAASVVYLPVFQKISSPVTVTFTLTPTEQ